MRAIRGFVVVLVAVLVAASCSSDPPEAQAPATSAKPATDAPLKTGTLKVTDAVFVLNPDNSATLSASVANGTDGDYTINEPPKATQGTDESVNVRFDAPGSTFPMETASTIGTKDDNTEIRLVPAPTVGTTVSIVVDFRGATEERDPFILTIKAPVVARTAAHGAVISSQLNTKISIKDGKVVVIPGQAKAYVSGTVVASIEDHAWTLPTVVNSKGKPIEYKHQTVTGGPYGLISLKDREFKFGGPPYTTHEGEEDYIDANDVSVGQKLTVTIPFDSGDVKATFTVVAG